MQIAVWLTLNFSKNSTLRPKMEKRSFVILTRMRSYNLMNELWMQFVILGDIKGTVSTAYPTYHPCQINASLWRIAPWSHHWTLDVSTIFEACEYNIVPILILRGWSYWHDDAQVSCLSCVRKDIALFWKVGHYSFAIPKNGLSVAKSYPTG